MIKGIDVSEFQGKIDWDKVKKDGVEFALLKLGNIYDYDSNYKGNSFVDALKEIGVDSSFANRKIIAERNGISNYRGTSLQNTKLLKLLKEGKLRK